MIYDAIIIGGGAAGLFCATEAGKRGRNVVVIEHNAEVGRKVLISGGGRCNFTNINTQPENFVSHNPHFAKSALARYTPQDFISLVKQHKIAYYEKKLGQLFCRESSRQIVDMLISECRTAGAVIKTGCTVAGISEDGQFNVETTQGTLTSRKLVIACGGLSFPKIGATDLGYRVARQFGLTIVETRPSLVALVLSGKAYPHLAGVSVDAVVATGGHRFRENILFTHRGLSGPAILQISNYWEKKRGLSIDLLPDADAAELIAGLQSSRQHPGNYLSGFLPQRFAQALGERHFPDKPLASLSKKDIERIAADIKAWHVEIRATEGYGRAEVTLGGVSTNELSSATMEAKKVPGLYFIGEVVDVTGWLGGYNFQWAWSSAFAAGQAL